MLDEQIQKTTARLNALANFYYGAAKEMDHNFILSEIIAAIQIEQSNAIPFWQKQLGKNFSVAEHQDKFSNILFYLANSQEKKINLEAVFLTVGLWLIDHVFSLAALLSKNTEESALNLLKNNQKVFLEQTLDLLAALREKTLSLDNLQESHDLLRQTVDQFPDILVVKDEHGDFLICNQRTAQLYGTTPAAMVGKHDDDFGVPKAIADSFRKNVLSIMQKSEMEIVYEDSRDAASDEIRHFKSIKKPFKNQEGKNRILVIAQDITDEVRSKNRAIQQQIFLKTLIQTIPDLVWLKDPQGIYLACNPRFEALYGAKEADIIGKTDYDFVDKEIADTFRYHDKKAIETGRSVMNEEWLTFAKDGLRKLSKTTKTPMYDEEGRLLGVLGVGHDITQQRQSEERLKYALSGSSDGLWDWDMETDAVYYSPRWFEMLGYRYGDFPETLDTFEQLVHPEDRQKAYVLVADYLAGKVDKFSIEFRLRHKNGHWRYILCRASLAKDNQGNLLKPTRLVGTHVDISERKAMEEKLRQLAHYDPLTNLPNRLLFSERLQEAILESQRLQVMMAVVYLDLDGFKQVNDQHGHAVGDQLLVILAKRMKNTLRHGDTLSRLGGDEFAAILRNFKEKEEAITILQRLQQVAATPIYLGNHQLQVSASIGVTFYPQQEEIFADQLLRQSDQAMYQAKQSGKNRYYIFN